MNIKRFFLIGITLIITAIFIFSIYVWADEFKHIFFFTGDYLSLIMVFAFIISLTGIFKWLLKEEIKITKKRNKK